eukprot:EG_transcript_31508
MHCHHFKEDDENKFIYTDIHLKYVQEIERYIERTLREEIEGFDMATFASLLQSRKEEVTGDIWDLLVSFTDFLTFKELMLAHQRQLKRTMQLDAPGEVDGDLSLIGRSPKKQSQL